MKTIGLIGGLSPQSTLSYYRGLNEGMQARLGGHHSARILLSSVDFAAFVALKDKGDWTTQGELLATEAARLERAGADFLVLATNTMHLLTPTIEAAITIPFLHLADATAREIRTAGLTQVGLLGTRYTMEFDFYKERLKGHGIAALVPDEAGRDIVNRIIYDELCHGRIEASSREAYRRIIADLAAKGAQGLIMGCTEIALLISAPDADIPLFDTTAIHIEAALDMALT